MRKVTAGTHRLKMKEMKFYRRLFMDFLRADDMDVGWGRWDKILRCGLGIKDCFYRISHISDHISVIRCLVSSIQYPIPKH